MAVDMKLKYLLLFYVLESPIQEVLIRCSVFTCPVDIVQVSFNDNGLVEILKGGKILYLTAWSLILRVISRLRLSGLLLYRYFFMETSFIFI